MKKIAWVIVITLVLIAVQLPVRAGAIAEGCAGLKLTEILANVDEVDRFIEIFNSTAAPMDLTGCQIITLNEGGNPPSGSKTWAFGAEILDAGQYRAVKITDTTLKLNKTTGGTIRILSADGVVDEVIYNKQSANKSWALIGGIWQNANSTPGAANEQVVKPPVDPDPDPEPGDGGDTDPEPPTEPIEPTGNACAELKITEIVANVDENDKFIEIFNPTAVPLNLAGCLIITYNESGNPPSGSKMWNFGAEFLDAAAFRVVKIIDTTLKLNKTTGGTVCILSIYGLVEEDCVSYSKLKSGSAWALIGEEWQEIFTPTPGAANPLPVPPNLCEGLRLNEIGANLDEQFIEIMNAADHDVDLTDCRLMTNRSATKYYAFDNDILPVGALKVIKIADTELTLTKTTAGKVYLLSSDGKNEVDAVEYANLSKDTSWALVDGEWVQTYVITMGGGNIFQEFPACQSGYFRNLETGRCNKIVEPAVLAPCAPGQYRNPETNRCKKLESESTLTPCQEGYERNPLTNRCRKIASDTSGPKPCAEGYERNPETNRCRKIVSTAPGQYAVKMNPPGENNLWKWASGGVVLATLAVVALQYRMEIGQFFQKLSRKTRRRDFAAEVE